MQDIDQLLVYIVGQGPTFDLAHTSSQTTYL